MPAKPQQTAKQHSITFPLLSVEYWILKIVPSMRSMCTSGSTTAPEHLTFATFTEIWSTHQDPANKNLITIQTDSKIPADKELAYLKRTIERAAHDVANYKHHEGSWIRKQDGSKVRRRQISSIDASIVEDYSLSDMMACGAHTPEEEVGCREFMSLVRVSKLLFATCIRVNIDTKNIPGLSNENLLKNSLYTSLIEYVDTGVDSYLEKMHKTLWFQAGLSRQGWIQWQNELPALKEKLLDATGLHKMLIKDQMLRCMNIEVSKKSRETLRRSLNHATASSGLMILTTWLTWAPKDGYVEDFKDIAGDFFEEALKTYSKKRNDHLNCAKRFTEYLQTIEANSPMPRRTLRRLLAEVVYDEEYELLSGAKRGRIQRLIRTCGILAENLRPLIETAPLTY